ncbi:MAG: 50S ribosomal protein L9 [Raoultibacter sp.]
MKVILLQELKGKGGEGDVVEVTSGFANNYLLPRKIAIKATPGQLKQLEQRKHTIASREENRLADAAKLKESLAGRVVKVEAKVGEEGQLFGSVTAQMIADAVKKELDIEVDKKRLDLKAPIKVAGAHEVVLSIYRDIKATLKLSVGSAEAIEAAQAAEELKTDEDAIVAEAGDSVAAADAAETAAEVLDAESK